jgi:hypothetical protein
MKKILLLALASVFMISCDQNVERKYTDFVVHGVPLDIVIIDSCEYIVGYHVMAHKGNCKFCAERNNVMIVPDTSYVAK